MKTREKIGTVLWGVGLLIVIGSVGALENGIIGLGRAVLQSLIGIGSLGIRVYLWRDSI